MYISVVAVYETHVLERGGGRLLMSPETQAYIMIVYVGTLKIYVKKVNTESNVLSIVCHT